MKDKNGIIHCKTPQEFNRIIGVKTYHPLISAVNFSQIAEYSHPQGWKQDYYVIALCRGNSSCGVKYGRNMYDYSDGTLVFTSPGQTVVFRSTESRSGRQRTIGPSWCIPISSGDGTGARHRKLRILFSYELHEALHLSEEEIGHVLSIFRHIERELRQRIDEHT